MADEFGYAQAFPLAEEPPAPTAPLIDGVPGMSYASFEQPVPPEVEAMHRPAATPAEVEVRKQGWMQVVQRAVQNPNLMRAIGMFGAQLAQPMAPGQSGAGHWSNAIQLGTTAYQFGEEAERQRARETQQDAMQRQRHDLALRQGEEGIAASQSTRRLNEVRLPGIEAQTRITLATEQDAIKNVQLERQRTEQLLANAKTTAEKDAIALKRLKEEDAIISSLPPNLRTQAVMAEYQKPQLELDRIKAAIKASNAQAGQAGSAAAENAAQTKLLNLQYKDLAAMSPEERRQFSLRTKGGQTSAQVQLIDTFKASVKAANPQLSDQELNARVVDFMTNKKADDLAAYLDYRDNSPPKKGQSDEEHFREFAKLRDLARKGGAAPPAARATPAPVTRLQIGSTATNPATGEKIRWDGAKWVPVK